MNPLQLWVNSRTDWVLQPSTSLEEENSELKPIKLRLKIDLVSYPSRAEGLVNMIKPFVAPAFLDNKNRFYACSNIYDQHIL